MNFPDFALVKLAPRDLTGPGIEFFMREISGASGGAADIQITVDQSQFNPERLYMLNWSFFLIPAAGTNARSARWSLRGLSSNDLQIFAHPVVPDDNTGIALRPAANSPFLVVPGGKTHVFDASFSGAAAHTLNGTLWGYSFPKGNVLSW